MRELAAFEADVDASPALVLAVEAELDAADALEAAALCDVLAADAEDAAAVAELAAAVCDVVAEAASTSSDHFAASVFDVSGCDPLEVCAVTQMKMLFVAVSLTISRTVYDVLAAQFPLYVPISCVTFRLPELSKDSNLLALSVADSVKSVVVIVLVGLTLKDRSISSCSSCVIEVILSRLSSNTAAGHGSVSTRF